MRKSMLLVLLCVTPGLLTADQSGILAQATSCLTSLRSCLTPRNLGLMALVGAGIYGLYVLAKKEAYNVEERVFEEQGQEIEAFVVTKNDSDKIYALIRAMEQDVQTFEATPECVSNMIFEGFDDQEAANGCEGISSAFRVLYEQSVLHPENKPFLEEFVMIFRQAIEQTMVIA